MAEEQKVVENLDVDGAVALKAELEKKALTIVVFGASGHLARTKTYPALFDLYQEHVYPSTLTIIGFARSEMTKEEFHEQISEKLKGDEVKSFLSKCLYFQAKDYNDSESFKNFQKILSQEEKKYHKTGDCNRLYYLATPPNVFVDICHQIKNHLEDNIKLNHSNWNRVIIEKPFGHDYDSNINLSKNIAKYLKEEQIFRIDHYLAKEMVQNILVLRFANTIWDLIWDRKSIRCIKISMKETDGVAGRGGYYDEYGVIRDVFQNHLLQVLTLICMENPVSLNAEDVRNEKLKVLKCIPSIKLSNCISGQYIKSKDGKQLGYRDDESIQKINPNSKQLTFFQSILFINNHRWCGVPFICKCGKALDAKNTEVRIQFKSDGLPLYPNAQFNELVIRLQPSEAIWLKLNNKTPGFARFDQVMPSELDLTYRHRFGNIKLPEAYTRLILDCLKGDQSLFVREDELAESWRIVTPVLKEIEKNQEEPTKYHFGSRGPEEADKMAEQYGFRRVEGYSYL